jgi:hypothetical protein
MVLYRNSNGHYAPYGGSSLRPLDPSFGPYNDICLMDEDSFQYWLQGASIEELEVFGRFTPQSKKRKYKRNIIQLLLDFLNHE